MNVCEVIIMANFTPEKCKQIALARLDVVHKWLEFRNKSQNKLQADYDFVKLHNTSNSHLFEILGKISRGTLHHWKNTLNGTENYTKLIPQSKAEFLCVAKRVQKVHPMANVLGTVNMHQPFALYVD